MASLNRKEKAPPVFTHEGAKAKRITALQQLERTVMSCMLWEGEFYEDGKLISERIAEYCQKVDIADLHAVTIKARTEGNLRHVPLLIAASIAKRPNNRLSDLLPAIIQRADELTEFLAIYWRNGKCPLSAQVKKGLAQAFTKFNEYSLAKYDRDGTVKLKDVLFLSHAKPKTREQAETWTRLIEGNLKSAGTWENRLSAGESKKDTFADLMAKGSLGGLAFLRNLRNMADSGVPRSTVRDYFPKANFSRVLPFRFMAARKYAPQYEALIETAMLRSLAEAPKLKGTTVVLVDESASMGNPVSAKSDLARYDAAEALAIILREICEDPIIMPFGVDHRVVSGRGFDLAKNCRSAVNRYGTRLGSAVNAARAKSPDRIIAITDEQSHDSVPNPNQLGYMINVASARNGVGYGAWIHLDGFSESVVKWIVALENL